MKAAPGQCRYCPVAFNAGRVSTALSFFLFFPHVNHVRAQARKEAEEQAAKEMLQYKEQLAESQKLIEQLNKSWYYSPLSSYAVATRCPVLLLNESWYKYPAMGLCRCYALAGTNKTRRMGLQGAEDQGLSLIHISEPTRPRLI
eukprot:1427834-Rhodomonas_salina.1